MKSVESQRVIPIVDHAILYDNSGTEPKLVIECRSGIVTRSVAPLPPWTAADFLTTFSS